jgi:hypothetical protein
MCGKGRSHKGAISMTQGLTLRRSFVDPVLRRKRAMTQAAVMRILIGPYGLHAFLALLLALWFVGFL